jgi:diguanylate cyclase
MSQLAAIDLSGMPPQASAEAELSPAQKQQKAWSRFLLTLPAYTGAHLLLYASAFFSVTTWGKAHIMAVFSAIGLSAFAWVIRSGRSLKWQDSALVYPQVLFGVVCISLSYQLVESARGIVMLWLALTVVYDMRRLPLRQVIQAAGLAIGLHLGNFIIIWLRDPSHASLHEELINLGCMALLLPELILISGQARAMVKRRRQQKSDLHTTLASLNFLSVRDALTSVFNRRYMTDRLETEARKSKRSGRSFCAALLDLDEFKRINDRFGHAVGDAVLKQFAAMAEAHFRGPLDAVARWGGEEFVVLMPEARLPVAYARIVRLQQAVRAHDWAAIHPQLTVTFSAGLAEHEPGHLPEQLLDMADRQLYLAKADGRDRVLPLQPEETLPELELIEPQPPAMAIDDLAGVPSEAKAVAHHRPHRSTKLAKLILTADPVQRMRLSMVLVACTGYLSWFLLAVFYAFPNQLVHEALHWPLIIYMAIGVLVPYPVFRAGLTSRLRDPSMSLVQNIYAYAGIGLAYAFTQEGKAALLAMICLVQVYGFLNLNPRETYLGGSVAVLVIAMAWCLGTYTGVPGFDPVVDGLRLLATAVIVVLLTAQSHHYSLEREKVREERKTLNQAVHEVKLLTTHDSLTGLCNRKRLHEVLEQEMVRAQRFGCRLSVALVDMDHFKRINDSMGHAVGDEVLVGFGQLANQVLRQTDVVGRWGGEEFLVVMPETEPEEGSLIAIERLRTRLSESALSLAEPSLRVTLSAGIATYQPGETLERLLERADHALYAAKLTGRNRSQKADAPDPVKAEFGEALA